MVLDTIFEIEMWNKGDDFEHISDAQLIKASEYLINNLREDHSMPGNVWNQFIGILNYNIQHEFINEKQRYWLIASLKENLDQRDFAKEML